VRAVDPGHADRRAEDLDVELRAARSLDVEIGFDDVVAAGEVPPRAIALVGVDDDDAGT
jgi:hypothetical protein